MWKITRSMWRVTSVGNQLLSGHNFCDIGRFILTDVYEGASKDIIGKSKSVYRWSPIYSAFMINSNFHTEGEKKIFAFMDSDDHFNTKNLNSSLLFMTKQQRENIRLVPIIADEKQKDQLSTYGLSSITYPFVGTVRDYIKSPLNEPIFMLGYKSNEIFIKTKKLYITQDNIRKDVLSLIIGGALSNDSLLLMDFFIDDNTGNSFITYITTIANVNGYTVSIVHKKLYNKCGTNSGINITDIAPADMEIFNMYIILRIYKKSNLANTV